MRMSPSTSPEAFGESVRRLKIDSMSVTRHSFVSNTC